MFQNLHGFFPQLLSSIFGYAGSADWGLKTLSRDKKDFATVQQFLSPAGPVFKLIDMLQADDLKRYEFFINCLPVSVSTFSCLFAGWFSGAAVNVCLSMFLFTVITIKANYG